MHKVKFFRKQAGKSQADLAKEIGLVPSAISNYENGTRTIDIPTAQKIVRALNRWGMDVSLSDVFPVEQTAA